jgi:hypothetical protein
MVEEMIMQDHLTKRNQLDIPLEIEFHLIQISLQSALQLNQEAPV